MDIVGKSQFKERISRKGNPFFFAFDLLRLESKDLRNLSLVERKRRLEEIVQPSDCERIFYAQHVEAHGITFFKQNVITTRRVLLPSDG